MSLVSRGREWPRRRWWLLVCAGAIALGGMTGCAGNPIPIPPEKYVKAQDQAGTVLVAATMVAPWDDVAPSLAPAFTMNGTTAATLVLPTTEQIGQQSLDTTAVAIGLGFPHAASASPASSATGAAGSGSAASATTAAPSTTTTTTTTSTGSTSTPSAASPAASPGTNVPAPTITLPTTLPTSPFTAALTGVDPVLRYKAATYLNQEVQLLNQEVSEAARRHCYVPFVVKLKLAFMPYQNPLPYSAHTLISFLQGDSDRPSTYPHYGGRSLTKGSEAGCEDPGAVPMVVPFLAADDLQLAAYSNTAEEAAQVALAATFVAHGLTGNVNASHLYEALTAIQNQELHSSLTVARTQDNGLYVLIAPNNEATGKPALVGQTYDVAVLLLVPRDYFGPVDPNCHCLPPTHPAQVSLITYTQFRDTRDGVVLPDREPATFTGDIVHVLGPNLLDPEIEKIKQMSMSDQLGMLGPLMAPIEDGNYGEFYDALRQASARQRGDAGLSRDAADLAYAQATSDPCPLGHFYDKRLCFPAADAAAIWGALSSLDFEIPLKQAGFEAPLPRKIVIPAQNVVFTDDKTGTVSIVLGGVEGASAATLTASLNVTPQQNTPAPSSSDASDSATATASPANPCRDKTQPKTPVTKCGKTPVTTTAPPPTMGAQVSLPAQSIALDSTAHTLTMTFPAPSKAGVTAIWQDAAGAPPTSVLAIKQLGCEDPSLLCPQFVPVTLPVTLGQPDATSAAATAAVFSLVDAGNTVLVDSTGAAALPFLINSVKTGAIVTASVAGGDVVSITGPNGAATAIPLSDKGYVLPLAGAYVLNLTNVNPGAMITLSVSATKPDPAGGAKNVPGGSASHTFVALAKPPAVKTGS